MSTGNENDCEKRFAREWRAWLGRPVRRPPGVAAARVAELLRAPRSRRRPAWILGSAAATLAFLVGMVVFLPRRMSEELPVPPGPSPIVAEPVQPGEVLIWLDEDTLLYMHFLPPGSEGGSKS